MQYLAQRAFKATPQTVRAARDFAMKTLDNWGACPRRDDIRTCVSELAGNAVEHGSPEHRDYMIRLVQNPYCLHVEVHDTTTDTPVHTPHTSPSEEAGRGISIVQQLSDEWGVRTTPTGSGKAVWTCFRTDGSTDAMPSPSTPAIPSTRDDLRTRGPTDTHCGHSGNAGSPGREPRQSDANANPSGAVCP
ncbi:ATP-binding protein [Streptomyces sp. NPDC047009]|uniref:ATP-binding protein n=1 Tax=Streptomyces sp. NPDC047009 TaxID=3154496 RepID=UPI0033BFC5EE